MGFDNSITYNSTNYKYMGVIQMKELLSRFKSPVTITATSSLIFFIVKYWCGFEIPYFDKFVTLLISVLVAFGITNNPSDANNF